MPTKAGAVLTLLAAGLGSTFAATALSQAAATAAASSRTVELSPGDDIQTFVSDEPEGTTFVLLPGVYRMQSIEPKDNDVFIGQAGTILNGSKVLAFSAVAGKSLWDAAAAPLAPDGGYCQATSPLCNQDQDLFIDGVLQTPLTSLTGLKAGEWYFDRNAGRVYIPVNPSGHVVELGTAQFAFSGTATGVQVEALVVEEYANRAQTGAVGGYKDGNNWVVSHVESRYNHGTGISLGPGGQILDSYSHNNGQMGIGITNGAGSKVVGNELSWNNYAGYLISWEAGGSKFWNTTGLLVQDNYVHQNYGAGLWADYDNSGATFEGNTVAYNDGAGIVYEISYSATIEGNEVENNGSNPNLLFTYAQILIENSSGVNVVSNYVEVPAAGGGGIGLVNQNRGSGSQGEWLAARNSIHNNTVIYWGGQGFTGIVDYLGGNTAVGNEFDYDEYYLEGGGTTHWMWFNKMTWPEMQDAGQEIHGRCTK